MNIDSAMGMAQKTAPQIDGSRPAMPVQASVVPDPARRADWFTRVRKALHLQQSGPRDTAPRPPLLRRLARSLTPRALAVSIPGPIFQKEVWISGRKAGTYWGRALYAAGMLALVTLVFLGANNTRFGSSPAQQLQRMQTIAPDIFTSVMVFQFLALALAGCILGAPTICEEKRAGTLGALLTTPLKAWQIVLGKTSAFFVQVLILTLIASPLMLAIRVFGGLSAEVVLASTCLALSTALLGGVLGLHHSIGAKRSPNAILGALVSLIASQAVVPLAVSILIKRGYAVSWLVPGYASAPWALALQVANEMGAMFPASVVRAAWISSTAYNLVLCGAFGVAAAFRLRRAMAREAEGGSLIPGARKVKKPKKGAAITQAEGPPEAVDGAAGLTGPSGQGAPPLNLPAARKKKRAVRHTGASRDVSNRPVLWRELRQSAFRTRTQLVIAAAVFISILAALYVWVGLKEDGLHYSVAIVGVLAATCIAAVGTTAGISGERESRTWEALLTTPLSARQIVLGKFLGALRRQWFVPALLALHFTAAGIYYGFKHDGFHPSGTVYIAAILTGPIIALSGTGVLFSLIFRKSTVAAVCNFGLALLVWLVAPIVYQMFANISGNYGSTRDGFGVLCAINPALMMGEAVQAAMDRHYEVIGWNDIGPTAFKIVIAAYWVLLTGIGLGAAHVAAKMLAARTGRRA